MTASRIHTPILLCKIAIVILGVVILLVGLYSHFKSYWTNNPDMGYPAYYLCNSSRFTTCPHIGLEYYFVAVIVITFILSGLSLFATVVSKSSSVPSKFWDLMYHALAAILVMVAAILYIVSAEQINNLRIAKTRPGVNFLRTEKLIAGILTIFQSILYGATTVYIARQ